jgi:hypothetical protein
VCGKFYEIFSPTTKLSTIFGVFWLAHENCILLPRIVPKSVFEKIALFKARKLSMNLPLKLNRGNVFTVNCAFEEMVHRDTALGEMKIQL